MADGPWEGFAFYRTGANNSIGELKPMGTPFASDDAEISEGLPIRHLTPDESYYIEKLRVDDVTDLQTAHMKQMAENVMLRYEQNVAKTQRYVDVVLPVHRHHGRCYRCHSSSHYSNNCFADYDIYGNVLRSRKPIPIPSTGRRRGLRMN